MIFDKLYVTNHEKTTQLEAVLAALEFCPGVGDLYKKVDDLYMREKWDGGACPSVPTLPFYVPFLQIDPELVSRAFQSLT